MKQCPQCGSLNANDAWLCECGNPFPSPLSEANVTPQGAAPAKGSKSSESLLIPPTVGCVAGGCSAPILMAIVAAAAHDYWSPIFYPIITLLFAVIGITVGGLV